jgi:hypothetical protein
MLLNYFTNKYGYKINEYNSNAFSGDNNILEKYIDKDVIAYYDSPFISLVLFKGQRQTFAYSFVNRTFVNRTLSSYAYNKNIFRLSLNHILSLFDGLSKDEVIIINNREYNKIIKKLILEKLDK